MTDQVRTTRVAVGFAPVNELPTIAEMQQTRADNAALRPGVPLRG